MESIRRLIVKHLWWIILLTALILLLCHSFGIHQILVDNTSLILLALVLLSPFVASLKKLKIGEFEAEIQSEEVTRVTQQAQDSLPIKPLDDWRLRETDEACAAIRTLADTDPIIALAKLRIELETRLRRLEQRIEPTQKESRPKPLSFLIRKLAEQKIIDADVGQAMRAVISICNRAIHGEDIRDADARRIIGTGTELLGVLEITVRSYPSMHPIEIGVITTKECDELRESVYRLTTVVPLVENPERHVYRMTQEDLIDYFDGCSEFAEFAVGLERIPEQNEPAVRQT